MIEFDENGRMDLEQASIEELREEVRCCYLWDQIKEFQRLSISPDETLSYKLLPGVIFTQGNEEHLADLFDSSREDGEVNPENVSRGLLEMAKNTLISPQALEELFDYMDNLDLDKLKIEVAETQYYTLDDVTEETRQEFDTLRASYADDPDAVLRMYHQLYLAAVNAFEPQATHDDAGLH